MTNLQPRRMAGTTALVVTVVAALLAGCVRDDPGTTTPSGNGPSASSAASSPSASAENFTVGVYYATETGTELRLTREFRSLPDVGGPGLTAAKAVLAGEPLDPDYVGLWDPAGTVLGVVQADGAIDVDLAVTATTTTTGSAGAQLAVQALA